jgi:hypothetical protein
MSPARAEAKPYFDYINDTNRISDEAHLLWTMGQGLLSQIPEIGSIMSRRLLFGDKHSVAKMPFVFSLDGEQFVVRFNSGLDHHLFVKTRLVEHADEIDFSGDLEDRLSEDMVKWEADLRVVCKVEDNDSSRIMYIDDQVNGGDEHTMLPNCERSITGGYRLLARLSAANSRQREKEEVEKRRERFWTNLWSIDPPY